jgi:DNA-binding GntR family transcriptional regulator
MAERAVKNGKAVSVAASKGASVRQTTYERLKEMILGGELRPGERLLEYRLSEMLGVSRTPLREALMKLEEEGIAIGKANIGYSVVELDIQSVRNLLVVRQALDACAAEIAAVTAPDEHRKRIAGIIEEMIALDARKKSDAAPAARELELGLLIHEVIAEATGNDALVKITAQVYQQLRLALWLEVLWIDLEDSGLKEHQAIADAIMARDGKRAAEAARAHVESTLSNMVKIQEIYQHRRQVLRSL